MSENEKKERYLFISCAGSGYQDEIIEFLKSTYIKNKEYYDHLQPVGSIYPLLLNGVCGPYKEEYSIFYNNLISSIEYLIRNNNLNKVVVLGEPNCAFYNDIFENLGDIKNKLSSQEEAFGEASLNLSHFLVQGLFIDKLEAWYMHVPKIEALSGQRLSGQREIIFISMLSNEIIQRFFKKY